MRNILTEYKLGVILSKLEEHPNPKYALEQYSITPGIAAHILFLAKSDLSGNVVYDLGCGTGRLVIGAALLGAKESIGVDIDEDVLRVAEENSKYVDNVSGISVSKRCRWISANVFKVKEKADTVLQFPPFEIGDSFFEKALELGSVVYSIHKSSDEMEKKIRAICDKHKFGVIDIKRFNYKIPWKEEKNISFEIMLVIAKKFKD